MYEMAKSQAAGKNVEERLARALDFPIDYF